MGAQTQEAVAGYLFYIRIKMKLFSKKTNGRSKQNKQIAGDISGGLYLDILSGSYAPKNKAAYAKDGYNRNWVVYRCVNEIANGASSVDLTHKQIAKDGAVADALNSQALALLMKPNLMQTWRSFSRELFVCHRVFGEVFIHKNKGGGSKPIELSIMNPKNMTVVKGQYHNLPKEYRYRQESGIEVVYPVDQVTGKSDILWVKTTSPLNTLESLSPILPGGEAVDMSNHGMQWNNSLLKKGARLSGALSTDGTISTEDQSRLRGMLKRFFAGSANAGETPVLQQGLKWVEFGRTPKDMDFQASMQASARAIASAFGVPFVLVVDGDSTYNNMADARESLWENTIIPLLEEILEAISSFIVPDFGEDGYIRADLDSIPALEKKRERKYKRIVDGVKNGLITLNEARYEIGFEGIGDEGDQIYFPMRYVPLDAVSAAGAMTQGQQNRAEFVNMLTKNGWSKEDIKEAVFHEFGEKQTDFPTEGDDQEITLRNSQYPQFDFGFAQNIKENHADVWGKGGNIRGNEAFVLWGKARSGSETDAVLDWIKEREAWAARHEDNKNIEGVVAAMKWGVIVSRGEKYMKDLIREEIEKQNG